MATKVARSNRVEGGWVRATIDLLRQGGSPTAPPIALAGGRGFLLLAGTIAPDQGVWVVVLAGGGSGARDRGSRPCLVYTVKRLAAGPGSIACLTHVLNTPSLWTDQVFAVTVARAP
jgi:hypothetical protein